MFQATVLHKEASETFFGDDFIHFDLFRVFLIIEFHCI